MLGARMGYALPIGQSRGWSGRLLAQLEDVAGIGERHACRHCQIDAVAQDATVFRNDDAIVSPALDRGAALGLDDLAPGVLGLGDQFCGSWRVLRGHGDSQAT